MDTHTDTLRFLQAIFPDYLAHAIFANLNPPAHTRSLTELDGTRDCYWSIAAFPDDGAAERTLARALSVRALVIDDVNTKVPVLAVEMMLGTPTAIVETSASNFQWVYRLSEAIPVDAWASFFAGVEKLIGHPLEGKDAVHLFRLPMGVNTKPGRGGFTTKLKELNVGATWDASKITPVSPAKPKEAPITGDGAEIKLGLDDLREFMGWIKNDITDRHVWVTIVGHGLKALCKDDEEGFTVFVEWSDPEKEPGYNRKRWDSFGAGGLQSKGGHLKGMAQAANPEGFARMFAPKVFDDDEVPPGPKRAGITATPFKWVDLSKTHPRNWLYGDILLRKFISMTVAPGGVGKSSLVAVETLAQVTGKNLLGEDLPLGELRVWLWNLEDPYEETQKKLLAAAKHYGISEADIGGRLFVDSGRDQKLVVAVTERNAPTIVRPVIRALVEQIKLYEIDVVVVDPFVSCHEVPENDNNAMDMVVKEWGRVAELGNCAVHLVDHTRKAGAETEVSTESSRGAKAKTDAARVVRVVNRMSASDGKAYGIVETWRYFNTFNDKANMAPPKAKRDWFRMESVWAGNGLTAVQAFSVGAAVASTLGDSVGVAVQWTPPNAKTMAAGDAYIKVVAAMGTRRWRTEPRSPDWVGNAIAQALQIDAPSISGRASIKTIIKTWISEGLFKVLAQPDENRKMKEYIEIAQVY